MGRRVSSSTRVQPIDVIGFKERLVRISRQVGTLNNSHVRLPLGSERGTTVNVPLVLWFDIVMFPFD